MFARASRLMSDTEIRAASVKLCRSAGAWLFHLDPESDEHALERAASGHDYVFPQATLGGALVCVNVAGRFYGPGYERGSVVDIVGIAELLERILAPCEVFYGGDSREEVPLFDAKARAALLDHAAGPLGQRYYEYNLHPYVPVNTCEFCRVPAVSNGGGATISYTFCSGCGRKWEVSSNGVKCRDIDKFRVAPPDQERLELFALELAAGVAAKQVEFKQSGRKEFFVSEPPIEHFVVAGTNGWSTMTVDERYQAAERASTMLAELARSYKS